jgi:LmbE family N-acetylglucosaminyl deacetylase
MHALTLADGALPIRRVLALGAHSDDIEIGCGATMLTLCDRGSVDITWVVLGATGVRETEAQASAEAFLGGHASLECHAFRDGFFPYVGGEIKDLFEEMKARLQPELIFTHSRDDLHQDHRLVNELTWNTWRDHLILEYEIPKYDGDLGAPNTFVPVAPEVARRKAGLLVDVFASQRDKHWFGEELFLGLMRIRGAESRSPTGYAEAFFARKLSLELGDER